MNMYEYLIKCIIFSIFAILGFALVVGIGVDIGKQDMKRKAVKAGAAYYSTDMTNGTSVFNWATNKVEVK